MSCPRCPCAECVRERQADRDVRRELTQTGKCSACNGTGTIWVPDRCGGYHENCPHCWVRIR